MKRVLYFFLFLMLIGGVFAYLDDNDKTVTAAVKFLKSSDNIKEFSISHLSFGAMDLIALKETVPAAYKENILDRLGDSDANLGSLGIAVAGLEALCEDTSQILSPKDFDGDDARGNLLEELKTSEVTESVFDESLILMGLENAKQADSDRALESIGFLIGKQAPDGKIGNFIDEHAFAAMALSKARSLNNSLVPSDVLEKSGKYLVEGAISQGELNSTTGAYGMKWDNVFYPSSTSTGLALSAISASKIKLTLSRETLVGKSVSFLKENADSKGFKDPGQSNQDFPNSMALLGSIGKFFPISPICPCEGEISIETRIEGINYTRFDSKIKVQCTNVTILGQNIRNKKASVLEALDSTGSRVRYNATVTTFGAFVTMINGEPGNTDKNGGIIYFVDTGDGYFSPLLGMADYSLNPGDRLLIAVAEEAYSDYVPQLPLPLLINASEEKIRLDESSTITVKDSKGNKIKGAEVFYEYDDDIDSLGKTDSKGEVDLEDMDAGKYTVWAEYPRKYIRSERIYITVQDKTSSGTSSIAALLESECEPTWKCGEWSLCGSNSKMTRKCNVTNGCRNIKERPAEEANCNNDIPSKKGKDTEKAVNTTPEKDKSKEIDKSADVNEVTGLAAAENGDMHLEYGIPIVLAIVLLGLIVAKIMKAI